VVVESFEWFHLETFLIVFVLRELSQWHALVPTVLIVHHTHMEHVFQHLVHMLCLTISLWMISRAVDQVSTQRSMQLLPKMNDKLSSSVKDDSVGHPMQT
jgi:hypothetical protein